MTVPSALGPNAVMPCPSESARRRHWAAGRICPLCEPVTEWRTRCPLCLSETTVIGVEVQAHRICGRGLNTAGFDCPGAGTTVPLPAWSRPAPTPAADPQAADPAQADGLRPVLPKAEMAALKLVAEGRTVPEIADDLHQSVNATKAQLRSAQRRLGAASREHAVAVACQAGLLTAEPVDLPGLLAADAPLDALVMGRIRAGLTQRDVARVFGKSTAWLQQREAGRRPFTVAEVRRYAYVVGVDLDQERVTG